MTAQELAYNEGPGRTKELRNATLPEEKSRLDWKTGSQMRGRSQETKWEIPAGSNPWHNGTGPGFIFFKSLVVNWFTTPVSSGGASSDLVLVQAAFLRRLS